MTDYHSSVLTRLLVGTLIAIMTVTLPAYLVLSDRQQTNLTLM